MHGLERKGIRRVLLAGAAALALVALPALAQSVNITTPQQSLGQSLKDIAHQTGENILFTPASVAGVVAHPLSGQMTAKEAVDALLSDTNLEAVSDGKGGLVIRAKQAPVNERAQAETRGVEGVETVVVTARRRAEQIKDVPATATVVTGEDLSNRGTITDTGGILANVPGVRFNQLSTQRLNEISIRGSGTARGTNADGGVGLYRNGVYVGGGFQFSRNFSQLDTFDLERAEILRGTQGALYGRNAVGGVINLIAAQPEFDNYGRFDFDWGINDKAVQLQAILNHQIDDNVAVRLSGYMVNQSAGFFKDTAVGKFVDAGHGWIGRGQVRFEDGPLDINLMVEHQTIHGFSGNNQQHFAAGTPGFPLGKGGYTQPKYNDQWNTFPVTIQNLDDGFLTASYRLDFGTLNSVGGYRKRFTFNITDVDGFGVAELAAVHAAGNATTITDPFKTVVSLDNTQTLFEDLYLAGDNIYGFTWLAGVELLDVHAHNFQELTQTKPVVGGTDTTAFFSYTSVAPYAALTYEILDGLSVDGEVRYTHDNKHLTEFKNSMGFPLKFLFSSPFQANSTVYNVTLSYHATPDILLFAKTGTGYRSGGFNTPSISAKPALDPIPVAPSFGNENTIDWELGAKGNPFVDWLYLEASLYKNVVGHVLTVINNGCAAAAPPCFSPPTNFVIDGGKGHLWGVELSANVQFPLLGGNTALQLSGSNQSGRFLGGALSGKRTPQEARWLAAANLNYVHPFIRSSQAFINLNYDAQWGGAQDVTTPFALPAHQLADLRTGIDADNWEFAFYAKNLSNASYPVLLASTTATRWNVPRILGLDVRLHW